MNEKPRRPLRWQLLHHDMVLNHLCKVVHKQNVDAGWWSELATGESILETRNKGELLMLVVTELAEAYEGIRKNLQDSHLPHRPSVEVELADTLIRIFDFAGAYGLDLGGAVLEKLEYNKTRADHTREHRLSPNGKKT